MKKTAIATMFAGAALFAISATAAASKGSCDSKAAALKSSQTVTLVDEWDPEYHENMDSGIYVMTVTLKKGSSYSIWTDPNDEISLDVDYDWEKYDAWVSFDVDSLDDGTQYARVAASDWDEEDPSSIKFYVRVYGDIGATVGVYAQASYRSFVPQGSEDNPLSITFGANEKTQNIVMGADGEYYISASLAKGTIYRMRTTGGTADNPADIALDSGITAWIADPAFADDANNGAYIFSPEQSGTYLFAVSCNSSCKIAFSSAKAIAAGDASDVSLDADGVFGALTISTPGATSAAWTIDNDTVKRLPGTYIVLAGAHTLKFPAISGYKASEATKTVEVPALAAPLEVEVFYSDTFDPKDDTAKGATSISFKNVETVYAQRTMWENDSEDNFSFDGKDGCFFDLAITNAQGDAVFSITNATSGVIAENVKGVSMIALPKTKGKYFVTVKSADGAKDFGAYSLAGKFANVGAIKFAKTALTAKETDAAVNLTVNRTAKDGLVRVRYGTVAGTAKPGADYVAQSGVLEWADGDNKAKTISIKLLPDLVPVYEGDKAFSVRLEALPDDEREAGEYPAAITAGECAITLKETAKAGATVESAYAAKAPKLATVKTETVPLSSGTFYGVLAEDGSALTNGFPALASVTLTAAAKSPYALSAKVALAGKTYTFSKKGWDEESSTDGEKTQTFELVQKIAGVTYTNTLAVTVRDGATADSGLWLGAGGTVELTMNVPDSNSKGAQEEIRYTGEIYRNNAKVQEYLTAVTNFCGYYTVALVPDGVSSADGIPAGNGYITLTIDNKGTAKVAGMLADGSTKPSMSVAACGIVEDSSSANGYAMYIPVFFAKSPACFGGTLRLYAAEDGKVVVDSSATLVWNNDNAKLTRYKEEGWRIETIPAGGIYDTIVNLQAYYLNREFETATEEIADFPPELAAAGYTLSDEATAQSFGVDLAGDKFSTAKKSLVKSGKLNDLASSVNPCNIQVNVARATGLVSGSFSVWTVNEAGTAQKEVTSIKHNGVLILSRDAASPIDESVAAAGFCWKSVKVTDTNPDTGRTSTRNWTFSLPFNLLAIEQDEPDWWAEDWGEDLDVE